MKIENNTFKSLLSNASDMRKKMNLFQYICFLKKIFTLLVHHNSK